MGKKTQMTDSGNTHVMFFLGRSETENEILILIFLLLLSLLAQEEIQKR